MKYCCLAMESTLEEYDSPIRYIPYTRSYDIEYSSKFQNEDTKDEITVASTLKYCPWCGTKFPKDLFDEWIEIIKSKFNIKNTLDKKQLEKIPKEYMTEEWWRKRGL